MGEQYELKAERPRQTMDGKREGDLVQWRNKRDKVGRLRWHRRWRQWVVVMEDGRMWDSVTGLWLREPPPCAWWDQAIGVGVRRCPEPSVVESQPDRRLIVRAPSRREAYVVDRRAEGASYGRIARELDVSGERVRQLVRAIQPRWR
jgi:hypothetical protein